MTKSKNEHTILPPLVCGKLHGHLTVKIDEVLWCRKCPGEVLVEFRWWGDQQSVKFRPSNIFQSSNHQNEDSVKIFDVKTSLPLFEIYLRNCEQLELFVLKEDTNEIIGKVYIKALYQITTDFKYQSYFPIINSFGNRIGDLHVGFFLWMKQKSPVKEDLEDITLTNIDSILLSKEQDQVKKKIGCNVCFKENKAHVKKCHPSELVTSSINTVLPNTERSAYSDTVISEILIKGQQLRDAMVMSMLEDCNILNADKDIDTLCSDSHRSVKHNNRPCSQDSSTKNREAIVGYLLGKQMSEEEEAKALETLRSTSPAHSLVDLVDLHNKDNIEYESELKIDVASVKDYQKQELSEKSTFASENKMPQLKMLTEPTVPLPPEYNEVNCFRLTVKSLCLTSLGLKKVFPPHTKKSRFKAGAVAYPVTTFFIECHMDQNSVSETQAWKVKPERFCSRRQIDNIVYFGQSSVYLMPTPFTLSGLATVLKSMTWLVCWKQLNQRLPSLLGAINFESRSQIQSMETAWSLLVETADGIYGSVEMLLELGRNKKYFGNILLEEQSIAKKPPPVTTAKERDLNKEKLFAELGIIQKKSENKYSENTKVNVKTAQYITTSKSESLVSEQNQYCVLCRSQISTSRSVNVPSLCVQCQLPSCTSKPNLLPATHLSNSVTHEFLLRIESVTDCPPILNSEEDVKCYIDYKFLKVDDFGKAHTGCDAVTSKVMSCDKEVHFASDHLHKLNLPATTPLSSCLLSHTSGITFQIWLRYFRPSPRDHMVAMANLPTSKLCALELQFLSNEKQSSVVESIELPLILVPSSVTTPYRQESGFGMIQIFISYQQILSKAKHEVGDKQKETVQSFNKFYGESVRCDYHVEEKENRNGNNIDQKMNPAENIEMLNKLTQTVDCLEKISEKEKNLDYVRRRFWTGEKYNKHNDIVKDTHSNNRNKDVLKQYDMNNKPCCFYLNNQINCDFKKHLDLTIQTPRLDEFLDSGVYSSSLQDKIPSSMDYATRALKYDTGNYLKLKTDFEQLVLNEIDEKDLTFYSLESDVSSLSDVSGYPSLCETKAQHLNEVESDKQTSVDDVLKETEKSNCSIAELIGVQDCAADLLEKDDPKTKADEVNNMLVDIVKHEFLQSDKTVSLSEEVTVEGLIENVDFNHENLVPNVIDDGAIVKKSEDKFFKAKVEIEQALHLPMVTKLVDGEVKSVAPSVCVSFKCGSAVGPQTVTTEFIRESCSPVWKCCWDVELNVELLEQVDKRLVFSVIEESMGGDFVFGFATADLNVLPLGLTRLRSWLNITDFSLTCKGQLKINITPLEDVTKSKTTLVSNLAAARINKSKEANDCVYVAQGQFHKFPSFIASQTEIYVTRVSSDATRISEAMNSTLKDKITEMEAFISGLKYKTMSSSNIDSITRQDNLPEKIVQIIEVPNLDILENNIPKHEVSSQQSSTIEQVITEENKENKKEENEGKKDVKPCASMCQGCHHCVCQHNNQGLEYFINPLLIQRFLTSLSDIQVNLTNSIMPSDTALNNRDYNNQQQLLKHDNVESTVLYKTTSCPQLEGASVNSKFILDQNISEFEEFLRGENTMKKAKMNDDTDTSSNATRASEISSDKSEPVEYCSIRETPEGGNPTVAIKSYSKLERQSTFVVDK